MPGREGGELGVRWVGGTLVGRDEVVDELVSAARAAAAGSGSIVLLTGEPGIGKTSVARVACQQVRDALSVSWGTCLADQSPPPYWPWQDLLDPVPAITASEQDDALGRPRLERLTTLRAGVRARALERPRVHVIEDLQWADVASVLLLAHVGATIATLPLCVIATLRTGEPRSAHLDSALEQVRRSAQLIPLDGLGPDAIAELLGRSGPPPDDLLTGLVQERTGGNPLFVIELLRAVPVTDAAARRRAIAAAPVPSGVSDLVLHRLDRLPAPVVDALTTASVIGTEGDVATTAAAHRCETDALVDLLDQARAAHFLDAAPPGRWRFRHGLIRDAVHERATASDRARRHALVLDVLAADPATPAALLAHHALAAQPLVDADRAVALAARAGEVAVADHAYEEAVEWFARALAAAPRDTSSRWRADLLLLSGEAHRHIGDTAAARRAFLDAAALTDEPELLARAALGYADPGADLGIAYRNDDAVTAPLLERAIAAQPTLDSVLGVQLEARLAALLYFSDDPSRARELADAALDRAQELGDPRALVVATSLFHDAFTVGQTDLDTQLEESARLLEWAAHSTSVTAQLTAHRARVLDLMAAGDVVRVDEQILAFARRAEALGTPAYLWWPALWSAMKALLEGRHGVAEERAVAAYALGETSSPLLSIFNLSFLLFFLRREQGRLAEMEQATRDSAASRADIPALRVGLTFLLAELGRRDEAAARVAAYDDQALEGLRDRNWPASWFQLARAVFLVGDRDAARRLLRPDRIPSERCVQVSLATVCLGAADLAHAWLLHTAGDLDAADTRYRDAAAMNALLGARSWLAQGQADHARLLSDRGALGDREEAERLDALARAAAAEIGLATIGPPLEHAPSPSTQGVFRQRGAVWEIAFGGTDIRLPDARGLRDLAYLLGRPGDAVSVLELTGPDASGQTATRGPAALDDRARREIRARLRELDDAEADAEAAGDGARAAVAREQRQELAEAVARDFGLGGRSRRIGDPVERARKTVSTRIRRTISTVARAHPELGRHLERSIDTGAWCAYRPAEPVVWQT